MSCPRKYILIYFHPPANVPADSDWEFWFELYTLMVKRGEESARIFDFLMISNRALLQDPN